MIYAISDIHGHYQELHRWLSLYEKLRTFEEGNNKLILLGDYIDRGPQSFKVLKCVRDIQSTYGQNNIICLRGNHENWFLDFLDEEENCWLDEDKYLNTSKGFMTDEQIEQIREIILSKGVNEGYDFVRECIKENHGDLIEWLRALPYYYETEKQIYVHAGIDEGAGDL